MGCFNIKIYIKSKVISTIKWLNKKKGKLLLEIKSVEIDINDISLPHTFNINQYKDKYLTPY
jgi:hypothetical protein